MSAWTFRYPGVGVVRSGAGCVEALTEAIEEVGARRCLAVLTPSVAADVDLRARLDRAAGGRIGVFFDGVRPHTPYGSVLDAAEVGRAAGVDGVVSVGGGAAIDTGRLAALCLARNVVTAQQLHALRTRTGPDGPTPPAAPLAALPQVVVPTTLSAAEFSDGGAATCPWTGRKELFAGPALASGAVLLDAEVAVRTPAPIWSLTGVRALDHAVETLLSPRSSPVTSQLALSAVVELRSALPAALADPDDVAARAAGQLAAWRSYFGVASGTLGLSHAIGHQLGARLGIAHAHASCVSLPEVIWFVAPHAAAGVQAVAAAFDADGDGAAAAVDEFIRALGQPRRLRELGVPAIDADALAEDVLGDVLAHGTPGGVPDRAALAGLLRSLV